MNIRTVTRYNEEFSGTIGDHAIQSDYYSMYPDTLKLGQTADDDRAGVTNFYLIHLDSE